jgi:excisionase family DNA binding protein
MILSIDETLANRHTLIARIAPFLPAEGTEIVLASGPDGDVVVQVVPGGNDEEGWELWWESNCPEWVCLERIWEHFFPCQVSFPGTPEQLGKDELIVPRRSDASDKEQNSMYDLQQPDLLPGNLPIPSTPVAESTRRKIESPYLNAQEAADYLGMTVKALYGHVERRKLRPMRGYRKYRFTTEQLDAFMRGEKPR